MIEVHFRSLKDIHQYEYILHLNIQHTYGYILTLNVNNTTIHKNIQA